MDRVRHDVCQGNVRLSAPLNSQEKWSSPEDLPKVPPIALKRKPGTDLWDIDPKKSKTTESGSMDITAIELVLLLRKLNIL